MRKPLLKKSIRLSLSLLSIIIIVSACGRDDSNEENYNSTKRIEETQNADETYESYGNYKTEIDKEKEMKELEDIVIHHPQIGMDDFELKEKEPPEMSSKGGVIRIVGGNIIGPNEESKAKVTIDFFFDPVCPASSAYNKMLHDELKKEIESGQVELRYRVAPYLNDKTIGDYSNRASAYILAVAEYAPNYTQRFISTLLRSDVQPKSPSSKFVSDDFFAGVLRDIGLSNEEIIKIERNKDSFAPIAIASAIDFSKNNKRWLSLSRWKNSQGESIVYTPFILINKSGENDNISLKVHSVNPRRELRRELDSKLK